MTKRALVLELNNLVLNNNKISCIFYEVDPIPKSSGKILDKSNIKNVLIENTQKLGTTYAKTTFESSFNGNLQILPSKIKDHINELCNTVSVIVDDKTIVYKQIGKKLFIFFES